MKDKVTIWPHSGLYIAIIILCIIITLIFGWAYAIGSLFLDDLYVLGTSTTTKHIIEFLIFAIGSTLIFYFTIMRHILSSRVVFEGNFIQTFKRADFFKYIPPTKVDCSEIVEGKLQVGFYPYLILKTNNKKQCKIPTNQFTRKQIRQIVLMAMERGAQIDYEKIDDTLKHGYLTKDRRKKVE